MATRTGLSLFCIIGLLQLCLGARADDVSPDKYYLTKLEVSPGFRLESLEGSGFRLLAKDSEFLLGEASAEGMDKLRSVGLHPKILEEGPVRGPYYLVYAERGTLEVQLKPFLDSITLLDIGDGVAVIRTTPQVAQDLTLNGLSIRMVGLEALPLKTRATAIYTPTEVTVNPVVEEIISRVTEFSVASFDSGLSGEFEVTIGGEPQILATRYSPTEGCLKAGQYLKETFEGYGVEAEYHWYFSGYLRGVAVHTDGQHAWAVNYLNEILRTTDGGESWHQVENRLSEGLWSVDNAGPDSVWVVGSPGIILRSTDGGQSFQQQISGVSAWLHGVFFLDSERGWVVGGGGIALKTADGGENWELVVTGVSNDLYSVHFVDSLSGWACGLAGTIIHTTDGGETWQPQDANTRQGLYGIQFVGGDEGWAVGTGGTICHTTDGGENWELQNSGTSSILYGVSFANSEQAWVVGRDGTILHTSSGGADWEPQPSGVTVNLWDVEFIDEHSGWAVGHNQILKTDDGGGEWLSQRENIEGAWRNVVGSKTGRTYPNQEVIVCAHYDAISQIPYLRAPGADDNGSGTTAVEEAARILSQYPFEYSVKFLCFSGEEQGLQGSRAYVEEARSRGDTIVAAVNLDMIAYDSDSDYAAEIHCGTDSNSIDIGDLFIDVAGEYQLPLVLEKFTSGASGASDHASFWDYGYPAIMGIEDKSDDFNPHLHSTGDNVSILNLPYFAEYVKAALATIATLAVPDTEFVFVDEENDFSLPQTPRLSQNYPNPFNSQTVIEVTSPEKVATLEIFDLGGREVKSFTVTTNRIVWDGTNREGCEVRSGIYFYRLTAGETSLTKRMILIR
jgi:photosystem II stability/assembly factor-like uncharacterized protein